MKSVFSGENDLGVQLAFVLASENSEYISAVPWSLINVINLLLYSKTEHLGESWRRKPHPCHCSSEEVGRRESWEMESGCPGSILPAAKTSNKVCVSTCMCMFSYVCVCIPSYVIMIVTGIILGFYLMYIRSHRMNSKVERAKAMCNSAFD